MKIGLVGLPQSGKTTLFNALTGSTIETGFSTGKVEAHQATVKVPDERLWKLSELYEPKKTTPAVIEYIDLAGMNTSEQSKGGFSDQLLGQLRTVDAILIVVRAFENEAVAHPLNSINPERDINSVEADMLISDLNVIENRMNRLQRQMKGKKNDQDVREMALLEKCQAVLEEDKPLREMDLDESEEFLLRGFQFLTQKPIVVLLNIGDDAIGDDTVLTPFQKYNEANNSTAIAVSAQIECEISQLSEDEAEIFRSDLGITESAMDRLIQVSYDLVGLMSYFTVGKDEVRAWTIPVNSTAPKAAAAIHTDFERGFIRAEVVHYDDYIARKSMQQCKTDGVVRLEGKEYIVLDGDIINFRFAV